MVPRKSLTFLFIFSSCKESKIFHWFITAQISHHLGNKTEADGSLILHPWAKIVQAKWIGFAIEQLKISYLFFLKGMIFSLL